MEMQATNRPPVACAEPGAGGRRDRGRWCVRRAEAKLRAASKRRARSGRPLVHAAGGGGARRPASTVAERAAAASADACGGRKRSGRPTPVLAEGGDAAAVVGEDDARRPVGTATKQDAAWLGGDDMARSSEWMLSREVGWGTVVTSVWLGRATLSSSHRRRPRRAGHHCWCPAWPHIAARLDAGARPRGSAAAGVHQRSTGNGADSASSEARIRAREPAEGDVMGTGNGMMLLR
ncbi:hypothetical protein GQ55_3G447200 [Panicum hallii var. hallii]|uniref:DUF834 domain-containing protein n=1 Tax=Panicum hallii var. hallii TaxID=1504633 RepID=A0A2T7EID0_9POAL|nr:hypothetical protein GQ55_3G447200 [Panicum hallii var. hallii]